MQITSTAHLIQVVVLLGILAFVLAGFIHTGYEIRRGRSVGTGAQSGTGQSIEQVSERGGQQGATGGKETGTIFEIGRR